MKNSYIFLADNFEEIEALAVVDILRRAQIPIVMVSMNETLSVMSSHGITVAADKLFGDVNFAMADFLILPGGSPRLNDYDDLKTLLKKHSAQGGSIAAICASPMVLGCAGLLEGRSVTCYPGFEEYLHGATIVNEPVVKDGNIITGNGPAASLKFAYTIVEEILGASVAETIKSQMIFKA